MLSKAIFTLLAVGSALAAPGGGSDSWGEGEECQTTCTTELCTQSSVYQKTTEVYETKTVYYPVTNWVPSTYDYTKTLTSTSTKQIVTSTPYTTVIWQPVTYETCIEVPYTSVCEETTKVAQVTSSATLSVCAEETAVPYTTQWVETLTSCATVYPSASWGQGGWGGSSSAKAGW
jgi:hypothetical protein